MEMSKHMFGNGARKPKKRYFYQKKNYFKGLLIENRRKSGGRPQIVERKAKEKKKEGASNWYLHLGLLKLISGTGGLWIFNV